MFSPMREIGRRFRQAHPVISTGKDKLYRIKSGKCINLSGTKYKVDEHGAWRKI
jgi:hypothetical protein